MTVTNLIVQSFYCPKLLFFGHRTSITIRTDILTIMEDKSDWRTGQTWKAINNTVAGFCSVPY